MMSLRSHRMAAALRTGLIAVSLLGLLSSRVVAAPGDLDTTFGGSGIVITDINNGNEQANAVAVQNDGRIVVAGYVTGAGQDFALYRYTASGSPDLSFGTNGLATTAVSPGNDVITAIALQSDGNIVVAGTSTDGVKNVFTVARYISATGALDPSFGAGGIVTTSISSANDDANAVALQSDGKIVVAGTSNARFAVVRYTITGTLDTTFHGTGIVTTTTGAADVAHAVAIQPADGKIVVAGESDQGGVNDFTVLRYTPTGALDSAFHTNGIVTVNIGGLNTFALATALQPDGKIVLAGYTSSGATDFALARVDPNGNLDTTFGATGLISTTFGSGADEAHAVLVQPTGKIVAVGFSRQVTSHNDFAIARYLNNGTLDSTFGTGGLVLTNLQGTNSDDQAVAAALDANNKIVVAGSSDNGATSGIDFAVARYQSPSQPPTVTNFTKSGFENISVTFAASDFTTHFNSPDGSIMSKIKITTLPISGTLKLGATPIVLNQEIPVAQLGNLTFTPDLYFFGTDAFNWNGFDGINYALADATVTLNLAFVNQPPSFTKGSDVVVLEDSGPYTATTWASNVVPGPANEASQILTFTLTTNNPALFAVQPAISISGTAGSLTFTPASQQFGTAIVTATLHDNGGTANGGVDTYVQTFTISVLFVNHAPSFTKGSDVTVLEDSGSYTNTAWTSNVVPGPANEASQVLTFTLTTNNPTLFAVQPAISISGTTGTLTFTPASQQFGTAIVTATLRDNGGTANGGVDTYVQTFTISVLFVNHAPSFTIGPDQSARVGSGQHTVTGWATNISAGPANEASQILTFTLTTSNDALFNVLPALDATTGNLTYTPSTTNWGTATVTVTLKDGGGTANGGIDTSTPRAFTVAINPYQTYLPLVQR